ncbi:bifunctional 4-hydroxy-3-methylbut-2-enyl diphosphate reductase/30S ribosomal protein S1 [Clostridia bacterium]|nr:bifunctional 4-hydroxy-3-methylbut-2-enyl diphosphate reductase/30S ribosomal protein S1 [Clostridia bacterium]
MIIRVAKTAGFCYGVRRAIDIAQKARDEHGFIYTYGPLIHNAQEVERLKSQGIMEIKDASSADYLVIRSHGIGKDTRESLQDSNNLIDATCPNVSKAQRLCSRLEKEDYHCIIVGDKDHPEVLGLLEWGGKNAIAVTSVAEIPESILGCKVALLSQTTQDERLFKEIEKWLTERVADLKVYNTICLATSSRQKEAIELAEISDVMIVIGGKHSANTNKLFSIIRETKTPVYHIEEACELKNKWFASTDTVGVTAGASTPDWIIEEVVVAMEEIKNETMEENTELTMADIFTPSSDETYKVGDILNAVVVQVGQDEVLVDIGAKREGVVAARELENFEELKAGDELELMLVKKSNREGAPVLSKKAIARRKYENEKRQQKREMAKKFDGLSASFEEKTEFEVTVTEEVKGGVVVDLDGLRGFVPASHLEIGFVNDLSKYVGEKLRVRIIELDKKKNRIVLSQKDILAEERESLKVETWAKLEEGAVVEGTVCRTAKFGAFVDLGGIDGLLHISEMGWNKVDKPEDAVNIGDKIEVKVLSIDRDKEKIALSLKALQEDPWVVASTKYPEGSVVKGKVLRTTDFGAFVEIEPGFEGLLHISELAYERVEKVEDVVKPGDIVDVKIIKINPDEKKIGLSIKATLEKPAAPARPRPKKKVAPKVEKKEFQYSTEDDVPLTLGDVFGDLLDSTKE